MSIDGGSPAPNGGNKGARSNTGLKLAVGLVGLATVIVALVTGILSLSTGALALRTEALKAQQERTNVEIKENQQKTKEIERKLNDQETEASKEELAKALSGTWRGTYRCAQGLTGLQLTIYTPDTTHASATFSFFPDPSNPKVPRGSFVMKGTFSSSDLELEGEYWIKQPDNYVMVNLNAGISAETPSTLEGDVTTNQDEATDATGCHRFALRKISTKSSKPPI